MENPETYRSHYTERRSRKLLNPRTADGVPDKEIFAMTRKLEERLAENESFVGVTAFGSRMKGYSSSRSDSDLIVFYDEDKPGADVIESRINEFVEHNPNVEVNMYDLSSSSMQRALGGDSDYLPAIALFLLPGSGARMETYRKRLREFVNDTSPEARTRIVNRLSDTLQSIDENDRFKRSLRINTSEREEYTTTLKRDQLWREHVELLLNLRERKTSDRKEV